MLEQSEESRSGFQWKVSLCLTLELELHDPESPFQSNPFYDSMESLLSFKHM